VLAAWFAAGIALLTYIQALPDASQAGLDSFIFGQAAAIVERDVQLIAAVGLVAFALLALFWKEFTLITFDREFASANGFRVGLINGLLSTLIVIAIVLGLQLAGVILMVGMLIAPGIAARQWTHKLDQMVILSGVLGAFAGGTGAIISAVDADIPTGPMIIVVAFSLVIVSIAFAPGRGLVWAQLRQRADQQRFAAQNALRDLYRYARSHQRMEQRVPAAFLAGIGGSTAARGLAQLERHGYARREGEYWVLTPAGVQAAERDVRNQQLWDLYREYNDELELPLVAEDRQKDIHEALPDSAVARLERKLEEVRV
jgi:manganese/zinc/iron transport system permease protein